MKFLIIQTAFIGDVILATPLIEKLALHFPNAQIDFLLRKGNESLLKNNPHLNKIHILNKKKDKYQNLFKIIKDIRSERFDHVINLHRFLSSGLITCFSGGKTLTGFDKNPLSFFYHKKIAHHISASDTSGHEVKRNLSLIEHLTDASFLGPKLYPNPEDFEKVKTNEAYITIAPASIWYTKQFPVKKWITFIDRLNGPYQIFLLGGKADAALCQQIKEQSKNARISIMAGQLSFLESAALMKNAKMNFVNDSAPLHIASAMNAPVTAMFCSTVPQFGFGPLSEISFTIETDQVLDCRPCGLHGKKACPKGHFKCADISIDKILEVF